MKQRLEVTFGFCAAVCIMAWVDLAVTGWFLLCALVHELGHWAALRLCGVKITGVRLCLTGAVIHTALTDYSRELTCAAAGPAASAALGLVLLRRAPEAAILSLGLAGANLVPLYPMDGGRILRAALLRRYPMERAERVLYRVTFVTCGVIMLLACWGTIRLQAGVWPMFAALVVLCRAEGKEKQLLFSRSEAKMEEQE